MLSLNLLKKELEISKLQQKISKDVSYFFKIKIDR